MIFDPKEKFCFCRKCCTLLDVCAGALSCWSTTVTDDIEGIIDAGNQLISYLGLVVPCSQSIPRRASEQRHHCVVGCNKTERHDGCWIFYVSQSASTLVPFPKRQEAAVPSVSHTIDHSSLLIWEDDHPTSRSRLEIDNEHLVSFKALGANTRHEQWSFYNDTGLSSKFNDSSSHSRRSNPSLFACWSIDVLGLLRIASRKLSRSTTVFQPLPARLLTPSSSSMRFLIT